MFKMFIRFNRSNAVFADVVDMHYVAMTSFALSVIESCLLPAKFAVEKKKSINLVL